MDEETFLIELVYCCAAILFFLLGTGLIRLNLITKVRRYFSPLQRQINDLHREIAQHKAELAPISVVDEFAKYFKKERIINNLVDDLKELVKKRDQQELTSGIAWTVFGKGICLSLGLYLARYSADLVILTMKSSHFYPFNFLLSYPSQASSPDETPVSPFSFVILCFLSFKAFHQRVVVGETKSQIPAFPTVN